MSKPLILDDLPVSLRQIGLADVESDARHLAHLLDDATDDIGSLSEVMPSPENKKHLDRMRAQVWIARDLAEILQWKLERMDEGNLLQPRT